MMTGSWRCIIGESDFRSDAFEHHSVSISTLRSHSIARGCQQGFVPQTICTMIRGRIFCISRGRSSILEALKWNALAQRSIGSPVRGIAATSPAWAKKMPDRPKALDESEFTEAFLKGSGPGGQKIVSLLLRLLSYNMLQLLIERRANRSFKTQNKTSSAVQLKHIPTGMVLKVQATRSRTQNRKIARQMLAERVEELEKGKESRVAVVGETKRKRKSSAVKKSKRKYRQLDEAKKESEEVQHIDEHEEKERGNGKG